MGRFLLVYRCLHLPTSRVILSRHVIFDETVFPFAHHNPPDLSSPLSTTSPLSPRLPAIDVRAVHGAVHVDRAPLCAPPAPLSPTATATSPSHAPDPPSPATPCAHADPANAHTDTAHAHAAPTPVPTSPAASSPSSSSSHSSSLPNAGHPLPPRAVPVPAPANAHTMHTRSKAGFGLPTRRLNLTASASSPPISPIPTSYKTALLDPNWFQAMKEEYDALLLNNTWSLGPRPARANVVSGKWVFRHKFKSDGSLSRYKARWVCRGDSQQPGIDFDETFSPVVKPSTICAVLSIAVSSEWPIHQLDVKNAFLHGSLNETVYCRQPLGFADPTYPDHVCHL